jgi:hypothetical protein
VNKAITATNIQSITIFQIKQLTDRKDEKNDIGKEYSQKEHSVPETNLFGMVLE